MSDCICINRNDIGTAAPRAYASWVVRGEPGRPSIVSVVLRGAS